MTVNAVSKLDNYPIPKAEDLFTTLCGGGRFTKLDQSQAYQQLPLDDHSKKYTTINTHRSLFQSNRLRYGISSAPGIFQRTMENLLQGISNVIVRVDDIQVSGANDEYHIANLDNIWALIYYYQKYLPSLATTLAPLYELLRKGTHWRWGTKRREAFEMSKELLK